MKQYKLPNIDTLKARESTGVIEARVDYRVVASLAMWARNNGQGFRTRGELVRVCLEAMHTMLINSEQAPEVQTTELALEMLAQCGLPFLDRDGVHLLTKKELYYLGYMFPAKGYACM